MADPKKRGLGRGLSALIGDVAPPRDEAATRPADAQIPVDLIVPNPNQPRRLFPAAEMAELTDSIRAKGVLQPLLVRPDPKQDGRYQIIAGERRWRAAQAAQVHSVPVVIRDFSDQEVLEAAIIENVQRSDLNPIDEAAGYAQLVETFGHSQAQLAAAMGKSRSYIANALRLLSLPEDVRDMLSTGRLSAGHARALITAQDPSALAKKVVAEGLSVRRTEELARAVAPSNRRPSPRSMGKDADTRALESDLAAALGLRVSIDHKATGAGTISISYGDLEELDGLCRLLNAER